MPSGKSRAKAAFWLAFAGDRIAARGLRPFRQARPAPVC